MPEPDPCKYQMWDPAPPPDSAAWDGNDPTHGRLWTTYCPDALSILHRGPGGTNAIIYTMVGTYYVTDGLPPGEAAPDPMSVLDRALGRLTIPTPELAVGPDLSKVAVKVPVWLWVSNADPITVSTTAGPITATVTAELTSTNWQMGEPIDPATPGVLASSVTCAGPGVAYRAGLDPHQPPCGYTYIWKSLPERTGGSDTWPLTVTATWTVTWSLNTGQTGGDTLQTTATLPVHVGEWHVVLIDGGR